jgi:hypothetical protein
MIMTDLTQARPSLQVILMGQVPEVWLTGAVLLPCGASREGQDLEAGAGDLVSRAVPFRRTISVRVMRLLAVATLAADRQAPLPDWPSSGTAV